MSLTWEGYHPSSKSRIPALREEERNDKVADASWILVYIRITWRGIQTHTAGLHPSWGENREHAF